jgi:predicted RNase H-like HicB family nuclease
MKQTKIAFTVLKEDEGYSAISTYKGLIATQGDTFEELKEMILEATNLALENENRTITLEDIQFHLDLASFFDFYKEINAKALAKRTGINNSLLSQYVSGTKKPSPKQVGKILEGIRSLGREMANLDLVV